MKSNPPTIAILTQATDDFHQRRYLVRLMIPRWEAMGFRVVVVTETGPFVPADIALLHVDLSVVPDKIRRFAARYPRVLNGQVLDIRKRRFSRLLVDRVGPDPGKVIVKTDWNFGGRPELRWNVLESPLGRLVRRFNINIAESICHRVARREARRPWRTKRALNNYPVYANRDLVPVEVWANPNLMVERFLVEREGNDYCCRHWLFLGRREVCRRTVSPNPVVKVDGKLEPLLEPVPEELRAIRKQLGFDYGKFDYGIINGEVFLYDANRTPSTSADPKRHAETTDVLAEGINDFAALI